MNVNDAATRQEMWTIVKADFVGQQMRLIYPRYPSCLLNDKLRFRNKIFLGE